MVAAGFTWKSTNFVGFTNNLECNWCNISAIVWVCRLQPETEVQLFCGENGENAPIIREVFALTQTLHEYNRCILSINLYLGVREIEIVCRVWRSPTCECIKSSSCIRLRMVLDLYELGIPVRFCISKTGFGFQNRHKTGKIKWDWLYNWGIFSNPDHFIFKLGTWCRE